MYSQRERERETNLPSRFFFIPSLAMVLAKVNLGFPPNAERHLPEALHHRLTTSKIKLKIIIQRQIKYSREII